METAIIVGVVVALVQLVKSLGVPSQFAPLFALLFGIAGVFALSPAVTVDLTVFNGIVLGLTASGLYSGTRATLGV